MQPEVKTMMDQISAQQAVFRAVIDQYEAEREKLETLRKTLANQLSEFHVGDHVVDKSGFTWEIGEVHFYVLCEEQIERSTFRYYGYRVRKDKTLGAEIKEIWHTPLHLA